MEKVGFTYDPLTLVRLVLDRYAEELEGKHTKAIQFARYEYLRTLTDDELEGFLYRYVAEEKLDAITLKDWKKDCEFIFRYIYESERYKAIEFKFNKSGFGATGLGVVDKTDNTFYDCAFTGHWEKIQEIIQEKYPKYYEPLIEISYGFKKDEHNGVTREQLDNFIMQQFELIGGNKQLDSYIG